MKTVIYICPNNISNNDICDHCNHLTLHEHIDTCDEHCTLNSATCKTKSEIRKLKLKKINQTR